MLACTIVGEISNRHLMTERGIRQSTDGCSNIEESVWEQIERQPFSRRSGNGGNHISPPCATSIQRINSFRGLSWKWGLQKKVPNKSGFWIHFKIKTNTLFACFPFRKRLYLNKSIFETKTYDKIEESFLSCLISKTDFHYLLNSNWPPPSSETSLTIFEKVTIRKALLHNDCQSSW